MGFTGTKDSTASNRYVEIGAARGSLKEGICSNFRSHEATQEMRTLPNCHQNG